MSRSAVWRRPSAPPARAHPRSGARAASVAFALTLCAVVGALPSAAPAVARPTAPAERAVAPRMRGAAAVAAPEPGDGASWRRVAQLGGAPTAVAVDGRLAVLGVAESLWVVDLTVDNRPRVIGRTPLLGATVVDVSLGGGRAVAALGGAGIVVVDVTMPTAPAVLARFDGDASSLAVAGDRVVACGGSACRVVRTAGDDAPAIVGSAAFSGAAGPVAAAHGRAYVAVDASQDGGGVVLHVVDITDPTGMQTLQTKALIASPVRGLGVAGDWLYLVQDTGDLRAYDLGDGGPPVPRGGVRVPAGVGATGAHPLAVAGDRVYVASGLEVSAIDVSQPTLPRFVGATPVDGFVAAVAATPSRVYVANHADLLGGRRAFHGLEVLAAAADGPALPLGSLDEAWHAYGVAIHRQRYAVVAAGRSGLRVVDIAADGGPREVGRWQGEAELVDVALVGDVAYAADAGTRAMVHLVDLSDPLLPRGIGAVAEPAPRAGAIVRAGRFVAVGLEPRQLVVLDAADARAPRLAAQLDLPGATLALAVRGQQLFVLTGRPERRPMLLVLDVGPGGAVAARTAVSLDLPLDERARFGLTVVGDVAVVAADGQAVALDASALPPRELSRLDLPHPAVGLAGGGTQAVAAGGGLTLLDVGDGTDLRVRSTTAWPAAWPEVRNAVAVEGRTVAAAQWDAGLSLAELPEAPWPAAAPAEPPATVTAVSDPTATATAASEPSATAAVATVTATVTAAPTAVASPAPATPPVPTAPASATPEATATDAAATATVVAVPTAGVTAPPPTVAPATPAAVLTPPAAPSPSATRRSSTPTSAAARRPTTLYLPLAVVEACPPKNVFSDIVLVVDASTSMALLTPSGQQKIDAAIDAVWTFLDGLRLVPGGDRAAIVAFNGAATTLQELTSERRRLVSALRRIALAPRSRVDAGIDAAAAELSVRGRPDRNRAMVVLSDGKANPVAPSAVVASARTARQMGLGVFVVGVGPDMDAPTLRAMAGAATRYFGAPDPDQLRTIYAQLARTVPCPAAGYWGKR